MATGHAEVIVVAHVIQQAVAPVFLLTGIGAFLSVLTSRLGRVIDRFRILDGISADFRSAGQTREMGVLHSRSRWIHLSITLCTLCALCACCSCCASSTKRTLCALCTLCALRTSYTNRTL